MWRRSSPSHIGECDINHDVRTQREPVIHETEVVAFSTSEGEFISASEATKKIPGIRYLLQELGID